MNSLSLSIKSSFFVHKEEKGDLYEKIETYSYQKDDATDNLSSVYPDRIWEGLALIIITHLKAYFDAHGEILPSEGLYNRILKEVEKPLIIQTLEVVKGNQGKAAKILGIHRNTLRKKIQELNLASFNIES